MNNLHEEFYDFRERCWKALEELVHNGCDYPGQFPIKVGEYSLPSNGLRTGGVHLYDTTDLMIDGILPDEDYAIFPAKESDKDINVTTNTIRVYKKDFISGERLEIEVTPYLLDLQTLSTYLSGGYSVYYKDDE